MPVSTTSNQYDENTELWQIVRDCVKGSKAVKDRGITYLPKPNADDSSIENGDRYKAYVMRASYINFTGQTKDGFLGMIARKESEKELNKSIEYLLKNANGASGTLDESIHKTISELLEVGGQGLLVDFPTSGGGTQAQTSGLQAAIKAYPVESVISWKEDVINGQLMLTRVVLRESIEVVDPLDQFETQTENQYRVLSLKDGIYTQQIYDKDDKLKGEEITPRRGTSTWDIIPFIRPGSVDNNPNPDKAPLYDLAEVNISHYRSSADFEESSFIVGQPTPVFAGLNQGWVDKVLKGGVKMGSRTAVLLPDGGSASLLQANENQMPSKGMELKETQMVKIGAKIIAESGGVETAEAAKIRFAGQNSKLGLIVKNTELAYLQCFEWVGEFMGSTDENILEINRQFYEATVNPQLLVANMQLMDRGVIAKSDMRANMRKSGQIDAMRTDEDIDAEVGSLDPLI